MATKTKGMKIEAELKKLTKLKREEGEVQEKWVFRLVQAALSDEDALDKMTDATYDFCIVVADIHKANKKKKGDPKPMVDFEGEPIVYEVEDEEEEEEEDLVEDDEEEEDEPEPVKKPKAKKTTKAKKPKPAPEPEEEDEEDEEEDEPVARAEPQKRETVRSPVTGKEASKHKAYRDLVIANNGLGRAELIKMGDEMGTDLPVSSRSTVIYHTKETIEAVRELMGVNIPESLKPKKAKAPKKAEKAEKKAKPAAKKGRAKVSI